MRTSEPYHSEVYKGQVLAIYQDDGPHECPLDWEQAHGPNSFRERNSKLKSEITPGVYFITFERDSLLTYMHHFSEPYEVTPFAEANGYTVFPLFKYEHGLVAYSIGSFSCPWDSGQSGFVLIKDSEFPETSEHGTRFERQERLAACTCEAVTNWCNGSYVGYVVFEFGYGIRKDGKPEKYLDMTEGLDSCWGFYDQDAAIEEAKHMIDACETERLDYEHRKHCVMCDIPLNNS